MGSGTHVMPTRPCSAFPFRATSVQEAIEGCELVSVGVLRVVIGGRPTESLPPHVLGHPGSWDSWLLNQSAPDRAHPRNPPCPRTEEPHSCLLPAEAALSLVWSPASAEALGAHPSTSGRENSGLAACQPCPLPQSWLLSQKLIY